MSINSVGFGSTLFGQAVQNLNTQLTNLSTQLATGEKSTTYSGMGTGEGFAIAARSQLSQISAFTDTITNVNTTIDAANTALQSLTSITGQVQSDAATTPQNINSTGQTIAQQNAQTELSSIVGILNTQVGNNFIFSGSAINTPSVASADTIMNGSGSQAGLKQVIAERAQADGTGPSGLGRLVITQPAPIPPATTSSAVSVSEDVPGSPFGLKLSSVSMPGATVTGPSGSPNSISISLGATNPNPGDQLSITFDLPDGTTASVQLTASSANPPPAGSFSIGSTPALTAGNLNTALTTAIGTLANTTLVAASAVAAGNDFFDPSGTATGSVVDSKAGTPVTSATALSSTSTDSLTSSFSAGDTMTVDGQTIQFYNSGTTPPTSAGSAPNTTYLDLKTANVGDLLSSIDSITGTSTPSTVSGGVVTLHTDNAANLNITSSNPAALTALGFSSSPITAVQPPLRVSSSGNSLVNGSADTVAWYTGNSSSSPRASETARVDSSITVQYGAQANEQAIRQQLEGVAVFAAVTVSPTGGNSAAQIISALSSRTATNLTAQPGQQTISDIQTDYAAAQTIMSAASARQTQSTNQLQNVISQTETVSTQEVASQLLALQNSLSASYEATSMLAQLTLTKFLPAGG